LIEKAAALIEKAAALIEKAAALIEKAAALIEKAAALIEKSVAFRPLVRRQQPVGQTASGWRLESGRPQCLQKQASPLTMLQKQASPLAMHCIPSHNAW
jgi:hypothetical protein